MTSLAKKHPPTPEQAAIIRAVLDTTLSIFAEADAGVGKSTTIEMLAAVMPPKPTLAVAFNKKIAVDLEKRVPAYFTVKTMNGLGHGAWSKALGGRRLVLVDGKMGKIVTQLLREQSFEASREQWAEIVQWASAARNAGLVHQQWSALGAQPRFEGLVADTPEAWDGLSQEVVPDGALREVAREALRLSTEMAFNGEIDFDDQIYCSVMLGGVFPKFPRVIVDESQDLNPLNILMIEKCLMPNARLFLFGDRKQSIYAFRGADSRAMAKLRALRPPEQWIDLPLCTTFRCPKVIVERQRSHAPRFRAAEGNPEGRYLDWRRAEGGLVHWEGGEHEGWSWNWLRGLERGTLLPSIAVLSRNTAPVMGLAFKLLRQGIGPVVMGRDIGASLEALSKKIAPQDATPLAGDPDEEGVVLRIKHWMEKEASKATLMQKEHMIDSIYDRGEALLCVCEADGVRDAGGLRRAIRALFAKEHGQITLGTGHRSKGLEWNVVVHLDPWRLPSKWAVRAAAEGQDIPLEQERNLKYVIETRAKLVLVEANLEDFT